MSTMFSSLSAFLFLLAVRVAALLNISHRRALTELATSHSFVTKTSPVPTGRQDKNQMNHKFDDFVMKCPLIY